jgi:plasmid stability protein
VATLTIRNIDESLKRSLRLRAARHGRSMEEEARQLLRQCLMEEPHGPGLGSRIARRWAAVRGVDLPERKQSTPRTPPTFPDRDAE